MKTMPALKAGLILLIIPALISGCVATSTYNALQNELTDSRQKNEAISGDIELLKQKNEEMARELQKIREVPEFYFKTGMDFLNQNQFSRALECFEKIIDRYSTDPLAVQARQKIAEIAALSSTNYEKILKSLDGGKDPRSKLDMIDRESDAKFLTRDDTDQLLKKREEYLSEIKFLDDASKHTLVEDDPTQSLKIYRTTRSTLRNIGYDKTFYFEIYIIQHDSGRKDLRIRTRYIGDKWISYDTVSIKGDNGTHVDVICKYPDKLSSMVDDRVFEWSDSDIEDDKIIKLSKSTIITVRFSGGYKYSFDLTDEQMLSLREIVRKYQSLR
jgi:tetratricopeptide (TPR) repeat protein